MMGMRMRMLGLSECVCVLSIYIAQFLISEEDEPMDEDGKADDGKENGDDLAKYKLDDYDKESKSIGTHGYGFRHLLLFMEDRPASGPFRDMKSLTYYKNDEEDPYITLNEVRLASSRK